MEQVKVIGGIKVKDSDGNVMNPASEENQDKGIDLLRKLMLKIPFLSSDADGRLNTRVVNTVTTVISSGNTNAISVISGAQNDKTHADYKMYSMDISNNRRNLVI